MLGGAPPRQYSAAGESSASSSSRGRDQSLQSGVFTIPACVLNSRPDQPAPHQRALCYTPPPTPSSPAPIIPPPPPATTLHLVSLCNFLLYFLYPAASLDLVRRCGLNKDRPSEGEVGVGGVLGGWGDPSDVLSSFFASKDAPEKEAVKKK